MGPQDIIVVAAYNAQVECLHEALAAAGLPHIRVGTVDADHVRLERRLR